MNASTKITGLALRVALHSMLSRMQDDPTAKPIAVAARATLGGAGDESVRAWIRRIEARRSELLRSKERVELVDYGAGADGSAGGVARRQVDLGSFYSLSRVDALTSRFLFELVRALRPTSCLELGTCTGLSAAYQGAALQMNGQGAMVTIEGSPELARRASETLASVGVGGRVRVVTGSFQEALVETARTISPVDYVFNDGHHLEAPTVAYFDALLPYLAGGATVVLDDIHWSAGMKRAWRRIAAHPRVEVSVDLLRIGVVRLFADPNRQGALSDPDSPGGRHYRWPVGHGFRR